VSACVVCCNGCVFAAKGWCSCQKAGGCVGQRIGLSEQQQRIVAGRCSNTYDTGSICQHHYDIWLHRYKPQSCAVCSSDASGALIRCPGWLQQQLSVPAGSFVHMRPCYEVALQKRKQTLATMPGVTAPATAAAAAAAASTPVPVPSPMDISCQEENVNPTAAAFRIDADPTGAGLPLLPDRQTPVAQPTQTQSGRRRHHCYSADDNPWGPSVARAVGALRM